MFNRRKTVAGGLLAAALATTAVVASPSPASAQLAPNDPNVHEVILPAVAVAIGVGAFVGGAILGGTLSHAAPNGGPLAEYPAPTAYPAYPAPVYNSPAPGGCYMALQPVWNGHRYLRERVRVCN